MDSLTYKLINSINFYNDNYHFPRALLQELNMSTYFNVTKVKLN